jgi:origin recognition complex subunit 1
MPLVGTEMPQSFSENKKEYDSKERARQGLIKGGMVREDSDDELGYDDYPWEWIYEAESEDGGNDPKDPSQNRRPAKSSRRRTSQTVPQRQQKMIVGARMGLFECRLGQAVLLKSPEAGKDWAGIISEFLEEEDEDGGELVKFFNIMWLASPDEFLSTKNKRPSDALPNEQYLTVDFNINPLTSINGRAHIMSKDVFYAKYPNGNPPKGKAALAEYRKCIICRRGVNQLQGRYTDEFIWEDVYEKSEKGVFELINMIKNGLKTARKRKAADEDVSIIAKSSSDGPRADLVHAVHG